MTQQHNQLQKQIHRIRRHWQTRRSFEGALQSVAIVGLMFLIATLLDWCLGLNVGLRWCLWLVMAGSLSVLLWRLVLVPVVTHRSDAYFAVLTETSHPGLENRLINAVQISSMESSVAPTLMDAIVGDAMTSLGQMHRRWINHGPVLGRSAALLAIAAALLCLFFWTSGQAGATAAKRVLAPWSAITPFTWTTLDISPANSVHMLQGEPLDVHVKWQGRQPASPAIHWITQAGQHRSLPLTNASTQAGGFTHHFDQVDSPMRVYATGGDGRSGDLNITLEARPRVETMTATIAPPAYTTLPTTTATITSSQFTAYPGSSLTLSIISNKPLTAAKLVVDQTSELDMKVDASDARKWSITLPISKAFGFAIKLHDTLDNQVMDPGVWQVTLLGDASPLVNISTPGRDDTITKDTTLSLSIDASDDLGLGNVSLVAQNLGKDHGQEASEPRVIQQWDLHQTKNQKVITLKTTKTAAEFGLSPGNSLQYWAVATDRNSQSGPGTASSQRYVLTCLTDQEAKTQNSQQILNYSQFISQLLKEQKTNLTASTGHQPALPLVKRQIDIRHHTLQLIDHMERNHFEGRTIITELSTLASSQMAQVISSLEQARDAANFDAANVMVDGSINNQNQIISTLESILQRLNRNEAARKKLKSLAKTSPEQHQQVVAALEKIGRDLDRFLAQEKQLDQNYEKMPKRAKDEMNDDSKLTEGDPAHRVDRWKKWAKGSIDDLAKLPEGFAKDTHLAESINTIFEEIEKKPRLPTKEIATPAEENAKMLGTELKEDLEMWMPDRGDNIKWTMEDAPEGKFQVPELKLPDNLQDMVGDLIEDAQEFDEEADDNTSTSGGNLPQAGWGIMDGPISSFSATGKTGNQLPNNSEITGRSGAGRRGKATGQMVGDDSAAMEGRPTPARVTNERYEPGQVKASSQLDPRGATGGGKKTGGGQEGLQGGTPPDVVKNMQRLEKNQKLIREKAQQLADALVVQGRSASQVNRAMQLFDDAQSDLRDKRYVDAARKRKMAIGELRNLESGAQQAVSLSLDKARAISPELRQQISEGASRPLPQGYEDIVGAYYRALSAAGDAGSTTDNADNTDNSSPKTTSKP